MAASDDLSDSLSGSVSRSLKNVYRDLNPHLFSKQQYEIHSTTVQRHLSNRPSPRPPNLSNPDQAQSSQTGQSIHSMRSDPEEKSVEKSIASMSTHSLVGDLPIFPKQTTNQNNSGHQSGIPKNKSAPSLSNLQRQKVESGLYLHPTQIPRSLSANFIHFQPEAALSVLYDLPMYAGIGIGGAATLDMLQKALCDLDTHLRKLPTFSATESESQRITPSTMTEIEPQQMGQLDVQPEEDPFPLSDSQAIPAAPDAIPPSSSIASDASDDQNDNNGHLQVGMVSVDIDGTDHESSQDQMNNNVDVMAYRHERAATEAIKHDIEAVMKQGYTRNLVIAVLQALLGAFLYGWNIGVLNVPQNVVQNEVTGMADTEWGLLNSMFCAGGMIGALIAGSLQDKMGRKKALLLIDAVFIISAAETFLYAENDLSVDTSNHSGYFLFWMGRFIVGLACGASTAVIPTYLGEIAPPLIRGAIGTSNQLTVCFGIVVSNAVGYSKIIGGINTWPLLFLPNAIPIVQLLTAFTFPESPKWLVQQGRDHEARTALQRLRMTKDVRMDMNLMKGGMAKNSSFVNDQRQNHDGSKGQPLLDDDGLIHNHNNGVNGHRAVNVPNGSVSVNSKSMETEMVRKTKFGVPVKEFKSVKWAMIIAVVLMWMQQLSGINAIMYYSSTILADAGITSDTGKWLGTTGIDLANFLGVFIPVVFIDRAGRRMLLLISAVIMIIASVGVSVAIIMNDAKSNVLWQYSSIGFLIVFVVGFEVGLGPIPWLMMAELAPMKYRGPIVSVATLMNWTSNLLIAQFSGLVMGSDVKLFGFAVCTFCGILFTLRFIPETNGKTADQIQRALNDM